MKTATTTPDPKETPKPEKKLSNLDYMRLRRKENLAKAKKDLPK